MKAEENEKLWGEWILKNDVCEMYSGINVLQAYKSALRKAIEEQIKNVNSLIRELEANGKMGGDDWFQAKTTLYSCEYFLKLMQSVEPE